MRRPRPRHGIALAALATLPLTGLFAVEPASGAPEFPSVGTAGLEFSASVATDPQRDVGEPEVSIDPAGNVYTCGPSGFSNMADYAQVSTDGGDQFHLLGQAPRGQISLGEGGGDCGLASAPVANANGHYTWAYTGLGPLANFSTATSPDTGRTLTAAPISESPVGVDRQWLVFTDDKTVFLNYNQLATGYTVQKSTDGGLTYGPALDTGAGGGRIGPLRAILSPDGDASKAIVYFPSYLNSMITVTRSLDGGTTWGTCTVVDSELDPSAGFVIADHDTDGNVYIAYTEKGGGTDTYVTVLPNNQIQECEGNAELGIGRQYRVNRDKVETTVMPWLVAGGPGRIAVAFFGTESVGNPDDGSFVASWHPYVSMSLDALSPAPHWAQAKATTHPFHYNSICLGGLSCDVPGTDGKKGDRSLADYFAMDLDPKTGRLHIVYGSSAKKPTDELGHVSTATVVTQESGPNLLGGALTARRPVLRQASVDPEGDALAPYSALFTAPDTKNHPALDLTKVEVGPEVDLETGEKVADGGITITMHVADLGNTAMQDALTATHGQSLVWLFRFLNGFQPAGATVAWAPGVGFSYGFDDFTTKSAESGQADPTAEKIIVWNQAKAVEGKANQDGNLLQISVPRTLLRTQVGPTGAGQVPSEEPAEIGSRLYDGTAFSMVNAFTPTQKVQSYLYPVDNAPAMDFVVGAAPASTPHGGPRTNPRPAPAPGPDRPPVSAPRRAPLAATGLATPLPWLAVVLSALAAALTLRRRRS